jgi:predicted nucleotidyltransferase
MREIRTSGLTRGRVLPSLLYRFNLFQQFNASAITLKKLIIQIKNKKVKISDIKAALQRCTDVSAAYLFGSGAQGINVANDLDILTLLNKGADKRTAYFDVIHKMSTHLNLPEDHIDLLFFDYHEADVSVLTKAVNEGILIKNDDPEYLSDMIDAFSRYLLNNEAMMIRGLRLRQERLEEFSETRS